MRQKRRKFDGTGEDGASASMITEESDQIASANLHQQPKQLQIITIDMAMTTIQSASFDQFVREVKNIDFDVSSLQIEFQ